MAASISLRAYQLLARKQRGRSTLPFDSKDFKLPPRQAISNFVSAHSAAVHNSDLERSWAFDEKENGGEGTSKGLINYGTLGFESEFRDAKTKTSRFKRRVDDVEDIPLFYEFWSPDNADFSLAIFQSFQGRSCVNLVISELQKTFGANNDGFTLTAKKLIPVDFASGPLVDAPVKRLTLIRKNASGDAASRYMSKLASANVDIEISATARRGGSLGAFGSLAKALPLNAAGIVVYDGISFNAASAEVKIGKKARRVGIFGGSSEAGVIDITDDVERGANGHPTFQSLTEQSDDILTSIYSTIIGKST